MDSEKDVDAGTRPGMTDQLRTPHLLSTAIIRLGEGQALGHHETNRSRFVAERRIVALGMTRIDRRSAQKECRDFAWMVRCAAHVKPDHLADRV